MDCFKELGRPPHEQKWALQKNTPPPPPRKPPIESLMEIPPIPQFLVVQAYMMKGGGGII